MSTRSYLTSKEHTHKKTNIDVNDLIFKAKQEKQKQKKNTLIIAAAAVSTLAVVGFVISL